MGTLYYGLDDTKTRRPPKPPISDKAMAKSWGQDNYGVFWRPNYPSREYYRKMKIPCVYWWFVDIDHKAADPDKLATLKAQSLESINHSPLLPSMLIETKHGYHIYWMVKLDRKEQIKAKDKWGEVIKQRLIPFFNGDPACTDMARLLRAPDTWHCKDPDNKFFIRLIEDRRDRNYSVQEMLNAFPVVGQIKPVHNNSQTGSAARTSLSDLHSLELNEFLRECADYDCYTGLEKLSGRPELNNEVFTFDGTQICVDGKRTKHWIDGGGYLGNLDEGKYLKNWVNWYCKSWHKTRAVMEKYL